MTALRHHTSGYDPHRAKVCCEARRRHIYGPVQPMSYDEPGLLARIFRRK